MKKGGKKLSLVMIVKDEEHCIGACLDSVVDIVDEIVIADTGSTDRTLQKLRDRRDVFNGLGKLEEAQFNIINHEWKDDFAEARNAALERATGDWILQLDADEIFVSGAEHLPDYLGDKYRRGYYMTMGVRMVENASAVESFPTMRLFRNREDLRYQYPIHEQVIINDPDRVGLIPLVLEHRPRLKSEEERFNRNVPLLLKAVEQQPENGYFWNELGQEHMVQRDYARAGEYYRKALKLTDEFKMWTTAAQRNLALCHAKQGNTEFALTAVKELKRVWRDFTDLWYLEGIIQLGAGQLNFARREFEACLRKGDSPARHSSWGGTGSWRAEQKLAEIDALEAGAKGLEMGSKPVLDTQQGPL
jgi:glycosyltransferase involved in cell wall biosynthesis